MSQSFVPPSLSVAVHCVSLSLSFSLPISPYPFFIFSYFPFVASFEKVYVAHARSALATIRFIIIPLFFAGTHKLPFFPWISRALCVPLLPLMSRARFHSPYTSPTSPAPPPHSTIIYPGYVTFVAKNTFCPGQLLMNGHTRNIWTFLFFFRGPFSVSEIAGSRHQRETYKLVIMILVS